MTTAPLAYFFQGVRAFCAYARSNAMLQAASENLARNFSLLLLRMREYTHHRALVFSLPRLYAGGTQSSVIAGKGAAMRRWKVVYSLARSSEIHERLSGTFPMESKARLLFCQRRQG